MPQARSDVDGQRLHAALHEAADLAFMAKLEDSIPLKMEYADRALDLFDLASGRNVPTASFYADIGELAEQVGRSVFYGDGVPDEKKQEELTAKYLNIAVQAYFKAMKLPDKDQDYAPARARCGVAGLIEDGLYLVPDGQGGYIRQHYPSAYYLYEEAGCDGYAPALIRASEMCLAGRGVVMPSPYRAGEHALQALEHFNELKLTDASRLMDLIGAISACGGFLSPSSLPREPILDMSRTYARTPQRTLPAQTAVPIRFTRFEVLNRYNAC